MSVVSFKQSSLANPVKYGSFLAGNDFTVPPTPSAYDLLETTILGSNATSVSFTNLVSNYASAYRHLEVRCVARTDRSNANQDSIIYNFNDDTSLNYARHYLGTDGSNVVSTADVPEDYIDAGPSAASGSPSGAFGASIGTLLDAFSTSKNKTARIFAGSNAAGTGGGPGTYVRFGGGLWLNTSALNSITISPVTGPNFVAGSRFSLYGIKAA